MSAGKSTDHVQLERSHGLAVFSARNVAGVNVKVGYKHVVRFLLRKWFKNLVNNVVSTPRVAESLMQEHLQHQASQRGSEG